MRRLTDVSQTNLTSTHMMSAILEVTMKKETGVCDAIHTTPILS